MIQVRGKARANVANVINKGTIMDHMGPMTYGRLSAEQA
jgi:hypothetical protein